MHVEHHPPDPDRDDDDRAECDQPGPQRAAHDGHSHGQQREHADHHTDGVSGRKRCRRRGYQRAGRPRTVGGLLGDLGDKPAELHADHQKQRGAKIAPRQRHHDHDQRHQPERGRPEHRAEHIPRRHPARVCDTVAMQRIQRRRVHDGQPVPLQHIADPHRAYTATAASADAMSQGLMRCHPNSSTTCNAACGVVDTPGSPVLRQNPDSDASTGAFNLMRYGAVMAVFLRKLFRIGKLPGRAACSRSRPRESSTSPNTCR